MSGDEPSADGMGEQFAALLAAAQDWARRSLPRPVHEDGSECQWCPLCQLVRVVRGEHPEVTAKLVEAGNAVSAAARAVLAAAERGSSDQASPPPPAERIDIDDSGEPA